AMGQRIDGLTLLKTGEAIDPAKTYTVAGWASVNEGTEGPAIWDVVESHLKSNPVVTIEDNRSVVVKV
ncbi:MAG: thiosulfohydrolase SoxB, partial [Alphaproteobacteria bacterium]|nr:thiosulfohydrolase SoxB [Alphaproteobacteria bacterium]